MYLQFFGFSSPPFSDTPDVRLFWEDHCSQLVFKSLLQGLADQCALQLVIAEPGLGKSVLCRRLHNSLRSHKSRYEVVFIPFPNLSVSDLLDTVHTSINNTRRKVLLVDEAQALSGKSLMELIQALKRQTGGQPNLQMVFFAQPELDRKLAISDTETIESLNMKRYELVPLTPEQTSSYINNRLTLTGANAASLFRPELTDLVFNLTGGVPRLINTLMRKSLMLAFEDQTRVLSPSHLRQAASSTAASVLESAH